MFHEMQQFLQLYVPARDDYMSVLFVHDYRMDDHYYYTGIMQKTGQLWTFAGPDLLGIPNHTIGRTHRCVPDLDPEKTNELARQAVSVPEAGEAHARGLALEPRSAVRPE